MRIATWDMDKSACHAIPIRVDSALWKCVSKKAVIVMSSRVPTQVISGSRLKRINDEGQERVSARSSSVHSQKTEYASKNATEQPLYSCYK